MTSKSIGDEEQRSKSIFKCSKTFKFAFKIFLFAKYYIPIQHILKCISLHNMYNVCEMRQMCSHEPYFLVGNIDNKQLK